MPDSQRSWRRLPGMLEGETNDSLIVIIGVGGAHLYGTNQRAVSRSAGLQGGFVESRAATSYI